MEHEFLKAKQLIEGSERILLTMHERMDGDDGGSLLAVMHLLKHFKKEVACAIKRGVTQQMTFLPGSENIAEDAPDKPFDLLITFGCSNLERTGLNKIIKLAAETEIKIINFDHHPDNGMFGHLNLVDQTKSSVAELVYDFFLSNGWTINPPMATCLLTGIITDTGSFMHSNTTASALRAAAELMRKGGNVFQINRQTSRTKTPKILKAWARALKNSHFDPASKIFYSVITENDLSELGELPEAAFEGFVEMLNTFPEAKFAMFLRQDGEIIKGSLRSDPYKKTNVSDIARLFGGGGHKLASGFSLLGKLTRQNNGRWQVV